MSQIKAKRPTLQFPIFMNFEFYTVCIKMSSLYVCNLVELIKVGWKTMGVQKLETRYIEEFRRDAVFNGTVRNLCKKT